MTWGVAPLSEGAPSSLRRSTDAEDPVRLGKYEVLSLLARGGMADLYIGRLHGALGFNRLVVVKRLPPHLSANELFVSMFLDEARLAAQIHHPNVVQILDLGQSGADYYIAMELIPGPSLAAVLRHTGRVGKAVPWPVAAEIVAQACDGLHAAHELRDPAGRPLGLVHRDVSPGNLMLTASGWVKVVDFGVARANETASRADRSLMMGKYAYMSPELCRGEPLDRRADVFALGVVLYQLLTGRRVFERETPARTIEAIRADPVPDPRTARPDLPAAVVPLIRRTLERERGARFPSAAELALALRRLVPTSPHVVAEFLTTDCGLVLEGQARSIREASQLTSIVSPSPDERRAAPVARSRPGHRRVVVLAVAFCLALAGGWLLRRAVLPPPPPLTLGMAPLFDRDQIRRELGPFLDYLEDRTGRPIELTTDLSYDELRLGLAGGRLDLAILPHIQVLFARRLASAPRVVAAMRYRGATTYRSVIVTRDNAGVRTLGGLVGRSFCYVDRGSASGYLVPRLLLRERGLQPDRFFGRVRFSDSHLSAIQDLVAGRCDGAAISAGWLHLAPKRGVDTSRLRVVDEAGRIPLDRVCVRPGMPTSLRRTLERALLGFGPRRDTGRDVLSSFYLVDGFAAPRRADFATLERALESERIRPP